MLSCLLPTLRSKVLVYNINRNPYFRTDNPAFVPTPTQTFTDLNWHLNLPAADPDPYFDPAPPPFGSKGNILTMRRRISVRGIDRNTGQTITWVDPIPYYLNQEAINLLVQAPLAPGVCTLIVELCDCDQCEARPGTGRCVTAEFPVIYAPPGSQLGTAGPGTGRR